MVALRRIAVFPGKIQRPEVEAVDRRLAGLRGEPAVIHQVKKLKWLYPGSDRQLKSG